MERAFRLLFNLHPGEWKKAFCFIVLGLFWSIGGYGTFTLSEGLFLEHIGAGALPQAYLVIAASMCLLSLILIFCLNRVSIRHLLFALMGLSIVSIFGFLLFLSSDSKLLWFLFKVIGWVMPISTYIVYWAFVDLYFDLQDGKRFFCLFNSVTFLGDALGGGLISFFLEPLGIHMLLLLFSLFMIAALPFIFAINQRLNPILEDPNQSHHPINPLNLHSLFTIIIRSKFTLCLLFFYFSMQVLAIVTEFNYMETFTKIFAQSKEHAVTKFIGNLGMWISLTNMFFGMMIYSRLVKKIGINNMVIIAPSFFLAIFAVWNLKEILPIAIFGMITREGIAYAFDDNNLNLLISGVPNRIKNQVRIIIESFFEPVGMFIAALLLLSFQQQTHRLGLILACMAIMVVFLLRKYYASAIFRNLVTSAICFEKKKATDWIAHFSKKEQKQVQFLLISKLKNATEKEQILAYEYLLKINNSKILPHLINHLGKLSLPIKIKAIELFSDSRWAKEPIVIECLERWCRISPHPAMKSVIHFYLARHGLQHPKEIFNDLHSDHLRLRAAAILTMKTSPKASQFPLLFTQATKKLDDLLNSKVEEEVCSGLEILGFEGNSDNIQCILPYLRCSSLMINRTAAKSIAYCVNPHKKEHANWIIQGLLYTNDPNARHFLLKALYTLSNPTILQPLILASKHFRPNELKLTEDIILKIQPLSSNTLLNILCTKSIPDSCRLLAGRILGKIDRKTLQKNLYSIVKFEIDRAYFYFYHAYEIQKQLPEQELSILENALFTNYQSIIDFIIQILGVAGSIEQSQILSMTLRSPNPKIRAQAIESLDKTCENHIFNLLEPLINEQHPEKKIHYYLKNGGIPYNLNQLLNTMQNSSSIGDQIVSISLKARLQTPDWRQALRIKLEEGAKVFKNLANELLELKR
ncbi:MAG: hypothetical protein R3E91_00785 [Chlamydiales bacterium]